MAWKHCTNCFEGLDFPDAHSVFVDEGITCPSCGIGNAIEPEERKFAFGSLIERIEALEEQVEKAKK